MLKFEQELLDRKFKKGGTPNIYDYYYDKVYDEDYCIILSLHFIETNNETILLDSKISININITPSLAPVVANALNCGAEYLKNVINEITQEEYNVRDAR